MTFTEILISAGTQIYKRGFVEKTRAIKLKIQEKRMTPTSLVYQIYQVLYLQSHKPGFWGYKISK